MKKMLSLIAVSSMLVFGACSDDDGGETEKDMGTQVDTTQVGSDAAEGDAVSNTSGPELVMEEFDGVQGQAQIETKVDGAPAKVELLIDGNVVGEATAAPYTIAWDSTTVANGVFTAQLKADGVAGPETKIVVYNNGEMAQWLSPAEGEIEWPAGGGAYVEQHLRFHFTMPAGVTKMIAILMWGGENYELELAIGVGVCPDSGETADRVASMTSPVIIEFGDGASALAPEIQWFAHVDLINRTEPAIQGKNTPYKVKIYLLK